LRSVVVVSKLALPSHQQQDKDMSELHKPMKAREIIYCMAFAAVSLAAVAWWKWENPSTYTVSSTPNDDADKPVEVGSICTVLTFPFGSLVCSSDDAVESVVSASRMRAEEGIDVVHGHVGRGSALDVRGSKVRVARIYSNFRMARVEVLSGRHQGEYGIVDTKWLVAN
jgi:hypothetical protein